MDEIKLGKASAHYFTNTALGAAEVKTNWEVITQKADWSEDTASSGDKAKPSWFAGINAPLCLL